MRGIFTWESRRSKPRSGEVIAGEVPIHGYRCCDPKFVGNGVLIGVESWIPVHATVTEFLIPAVRGNVPEDSRSVCKRLHPAVTMPWHCLQTTSEL